MPLSRLLLMLPFLVGCGASPGSQDSWSADLLHLDPEAEHQLLAAADTVAVGRITAITEKGEPRPALRDPRIRVQPFEMRVAVEAVGRGSIQSPEIGILMFLYAKDNARELGRPIFIPKVGARRVWFLKRQENGFRAAVDVLELGFRLSQPMGDFSKCAASAGCCVGEVLLSPTVDEKLFVTDMFNAAVVSEQLCGRRQTYEQLKGLAQDDHVAIRDMAQAVGGSFFKRWGIRAADGSVPDVNSYQGPIPEPTQ